MIQELISSSRSWLKQNGLRPSVGRVVERSLIEAGFPVWEARQEARKCPYMMPLGSTIENEAWNILAKKLEKQSK